MKREGNEIGELESRKEKVAEGKVADNEDYDDKEDDDDDEEEEDDDQGFRFKSGINPLDLVGDNSSGLQIYQQFERLEYEALAEKNRKALADTLLEGPSKKVRQEDISETTMDEIMQVINYGGRRKSRKPKKRGRQKGSRNKLSAEIVTMLGDATLHYANGHYKEAIFVLNEVVRLAPNLPDSYHTLGLVHKALGNNKVAFEFYMLAGILKPKDSSL